MACNATQNQEQFCMNEWKSVWKYFKYKENKELGMNKIYPNGLPANTNVIKEMLEGTFGKQSPISELVWTDVASGQFEIDGTDHLIFPGKGNGWKMYVNHSQSSNDVEEWTLYTSTKNGARNFIIETAARYPDILPYLFAVNDFNYYLDTLDPELNNFWDDIDQIVINSIRIIHDLVNACPIVTSEEVLSLVRN